MLLVPLYTATVLTLCESIIVIQLT
jgi:hypothetical protein